MVASILRKVILDHGNTFKFDGSFPSDCEETAVPQRMKYFFRQLLAGPKSSPTQDNSKKVLSVSMVAILNMTSLSTNMNCEPPLAVFLAMKLPSLTGNKKLVELLHEYSLICHIKTSSSLKLALHRLLVTKQGPMVIQSAQQICTGTSSL